MPFPWEECEREEVARSPASYHLRQGDAVRHNCEQSFIEGTGPRFMGRSQC